MIFATNGGGGVGGGPTTPGFASKLFIGITFDKSFTFGLLLCFQQDYLILFHFIRFQFFEFFKDEKEKNVFFFHFKPITGFM